MFEDGQKPLFLNRLNGYSGIQILAVEWLNVTTSEMAFAASAEQLNVMGYAWPILTESNHSLDVKWASSKDSVVPSYSISADSKEQMKQPSSTVSQKDRESKWLTSRRLWTLVLREFKILRHDSHKVTSI
jgi:hypothetical protein